MAKFLQTVLDAKEPMFSVGLTSLEKATGNSGVDTRLIADIIERSHHIMRKLGLDPRDTTGRELYFALLSAAKHDELESLFSESDYALILIDDKIMSFNLIDMIENSHHELSFDRQIVSHGQRSLRGELVGRYLDHARTNESTALEVASYIGLLPDSDAWYTDSKYKRKQTGKHPEESEK